MRQFVQVLTALIGLLSACAFGAEKKSERGIEWYIKQYPYFTPGDMLHTFESEFKWPEGFRRLDPDRLTPFQNWVSNMPVWDDGKAVYSATTGTILTREKVSRPVRFPWRTGHFRDCVIPLQLLADYYFWNGKPFDLAFITKTGDTLTYKEFLKSDISYDPYLRVRFTPSEKRKPSPEEFNKFFDLYAFNSNFASLARHCEPIADSALRPGDLYVGRDSLGLAGRMYVIMVVATDGRGDYRYVVGTGCGEPCDLYIPLFHGDRSNPWLTPVELKALITGFPTIGLYRLKMPGKR